MKNKQQADVLQKSAEGRHRRPIPGGTSRFPPAATFSGPELEVRAEASRSAQALTWGERSGGEPGEVRRRSDPGSRGGSRASRGGRPISGGQETGGRWQIARGQGNLLVSEDRDGGGRPRLQRPERGRDGPIGIRAGMRAADGAAGEKERQRWPELADGERDAAAAAGRGGGRTGRAVAAAAR
jgi:hypothetical protein